MQMPCFLLSWLAMDSVAAQCAPVVLPFCCDRTGWVSTTILAYQASLDDPVIWNANQ